MAASAPDILIVRTRADALELAERLGRAGYVCRIAPLVTISIPGTEPLPPGPFQAILVTSRNGARALCARSGTGAGDTPEDRLLKDTPVCAVGDRTADLLKEAGFRTVCSAGSDGEGLVERVTSLFRPGQGPLLRISATSYGTDPVGEALREAGFGIIRHDLYQADAAGELPADVLRMLRETGCREILFFSPRLASLFATLAREAGVSECLSGTGAICLSQQVADALGDLPFRQVRVAAHPDQESLLALLPPPAIPPEAGPPGAGEGGTGPEGDTEQAAPARLWPDSGAGVSAGNAAVASPVRRSGPGGRGWPAISLLLLFVLLAGGGGLLWLGPEMARQTGPEQGLSRESPPGKIASGESLRDALPESLARLERAVQANAGRISALEGALESGLRRKPATPGHDPQLAEALAALDARLAGGSGAVRKVTARLEAVERELGALSLSVSLDRALDRLVRGRPLPDLAGVLARLAPEALPLSPALELATREGLPDWRTLRGQLAALPAPAPERKTGSPALLERLVTSVGGRIVETARPGRAVTDGLMLELAAPSPSPEKILALVAGTGLAQDSGVIRTLVQRATAERDLLALRARLSGRQTP